MKAFTTFIKKAFNFMDKEFWKYTVVFFVLMSMLYVYMIYAGMFKSPTFAYAAF